MAEKAGRIKRETDGSWDVERVLSDLDANTHPAKRHESKAVPAAEVASIQRTLRGRADNDGALTYLQAKTANEVLRAKERRLRLQQMSGELLPADEVRSPMKRSGRDPRCLSGASRYARCQLTDVAKAEGPAGVERFLRERIEEVLTDTSNAEFELDYADQG